MTVLATENLDLGGDVLAARDRLLAIERAMGVDRMRSGSLIALRFFARAAGSQQPVEAWIAAFRALMPDISEELGDRIRPRTSIVAARDARNWLVERCVPPEHYHDGSEDEGVFETRRGARMLALRAACFEALWPALGPRLGEAPLELIDADHNENSPVGVQLLVGRPLVMLAVTRWFL